MKKITFLIFIISPLLSFAQIDFGTPTADARGGSVTSTAKDWEAVEINPANLGWSDNHGFSFSIMNVALNLQDNAITINELKQLSKQFTGSGSDSITPQNRQNMYNALTAPGGFNLSTTINWFSFSMHLKKLGGLAISLTDKVYAHVYLNSTAADVLFNGINSQVYQSSAATTQLISQAFQGTSVGGYHYRELNIDYGHKLLTIPVHGSGKGGASFENSEYLNPNAKTSDTVSNPIVIYGGFGIKPIWGLGDYSSIITGGQNLEEGTLVYTDPNYTHNILSNVFTANGRGLGVDVGLSASYKKWKLGVSMIDLGKITWQNNQFANTNLYFPALDSSVQGGINANEGKIVNSFVSYSEYGYTGQPNYTTELPSKFRSGLSYQLTKGIVLSSDFVAPLNSVQGNLINPYLSAGAQINVFNYINLGIGVGTEKGFGNVVPVGVFLNFIGGFDIYVATNDALAYLGNENGHVLSASFGLRLFGF